MVDRQVLLKDGVTVVLFAAGTIVGGSLMTMAANDTLPDTLLSGVLLSVGVLTWISSVVGLYRIRPRALLNRR